MHNAKIAENVNDRELFSEPLEPPINPLLIHMVPPFMNVKGPMFCLQINGEVVSESRQVYSYPRMTFYLPQRSILPLGCQLFARKYKPSQTVKYEKDEKQRLG